VLVSDLNLAAGWESELMRLDPALRTESLKVRHLRKR